MIGGLIRVYSGAFIILGFVCIIGSVVTHNQGGALTGLAVLASGIVAWCVGDFIAHVFDKG